MDSGTEINNVIMIANDIKQKENDTSMITNTTINPTQTSKENQNNGCKNIKLPKKKRNRCAQCRRKLGAFGGIECKCGIIYCTKHRYADEHNCTFDYKAENKQILTKLNPRIVRDKMKDRI